MASYDAPAIYLLDPAGFAVLKVFSGAYNFVKHSVFLIPTPPSEVSELHLVYKTIAATKPPHWPATSHAEDGASSYFINPDTTSTAFRHAKPIDHPLSSAAIYDGILSAAAEPAHSFSIASNTAAIGNGFASTSSAGHSQVEGVPSTMAAMSAGLSRNLIPSLVDVFLLLVLFITGIFVLWNVSSTQEEYDPKLEPTHQPADDKFEVERMLAVYDEILPLLEKEAEEEKSRLLDGVEQAEKHAQRSANEAKRAREEVLKLKEEMQKLEESMSAKDTETIMLKSGSEKQKNDLEEKLKQERAAHAEEKKKLENTIEQQKEEHSKKKEELEAKLKEQSAKRVAKRVELEKEIEQQGAKHATAKKSLEEKHAKLEKQSAQYSTENEKLEERLEKQSSKHAEKKKMLEEDLQKQSAQHAEEKAELEKRMREQKADHLAGKSAADHKQKELEVKLEEVSEENAKLVAGKKHLQERVDELVEKSEESEKHAEESQKQAERIEQLESQVEQLRMSRREVMGSVRQIEALSREQAAMIVPLQQALAESREECAQAARENTFTFEPGTETQPAPQYANTGTQTTESVASLVRGMAEQRRLRNQQAQHAATIAAEQPTTTSLDVGDAAAPTVSPELGDAPLAGRAGPTSPVLEETVGDAAATATEELPRAGRPRGRWNARDRRRDRKRQVLENGGEWVSD